MATQPTNETGLVKAIVKAITKEFPQIYGFKVHGGPYQKAGLPDLMFCLDGLFIGMEVKHRKPGESEQHARDRTTAIQRTEIAKINAAGGMAGTVISVPEALEMCRRAAVKQERVRAARSREERD